ncbi:MAG: DUF4402 domain-containing protein [Pacificimonas sp.]|jgi:hypothetical protein|nr:DUF4402 domain-containing protein [Pacificimonas sp.]
MTTFCRFFLCLLVAAAPMGVLAADLGGETDVIILDPLGLIKASDIDFGAVALGSGGEGGTITLNGETSEVTVTGGLTAMGGTPAAGLFHGRGANNFVAVLNVQRNITLTRENASDTLTFATRINSDWTPWFGNLYLDIFPGSGLLDIEIGGTLTVPDDAPEGVYKADFTVVLNYF